MSMMMGGFLTLCVSYTPVQMVSSCSILNQKYNFSLTVDCVGFMGKCNIILVVFISVRNLYYLTIQYDTIQYDTIQYDETSHYTIRYDTIQYDTK